MLVSNVKKFLFISNPKTGTTFIQKRLKELDDTWAFNSIMTDTNKKFVFEEHDNTRLVKQKLQNELDRFYVVVFIRSPYETAISAYFFLKNGKPLVNGYFASKYFKSPVLILKTFITYFNIISAKLLPFAIWSVIRPIKMNIKYVLDENGIFLVNRIGVTERLNEDFRAIFSSPPFNYAIDKVGKKENTSKHKNDVNAYFNNKIQKILFEAYYKNEINFYKKVSAASLDFDFRGKSISSL